MRFIRFFNVWSMWVFVSHFCACAIFACESFLCAGFVRIMFLRAVFVRRFCADFARLANVLRICIGFGFALCVGAYLGGCATPYTNERVTKEISLKENLRNSIKGELALPKSPLDSASNATKNSVKNSKNDEVDYLKNLLFFINDNRLKSLLETALQNNTNILTLTSQIAQSRESLGLANANMLPKLSFNMGHNFSSGNYSRYQINYNQNTVNANLSLSWEIDLFGKLNSLRKSQKYQYLAAFSNLESAKVILIGEVATNYYTLIKTHNARIRAAQILENNEKILFLSREKYALGLLDISTLSPLITALSSAKSNLNALKLQEEQTRNALLVLLNSVDSSVLDEIIQSEETIDFSEAKIPIVREFPQDILLNREDIKSSIATLNSQIMLGNSKKAALFPSISLGGSLGQILYSARGAGSLIWQITSSLTSPLLNRASLTKDYKIQKEATKQAYYALENTIRTALGEVENALMQVNTTKDSLKFQIQSFASSQELLESAQTSYKLGIQNEDTYLANENSFLNAYQSLDEAKFAQINSIIVLYKAFGGNLSAPK